MIKVTASKAHAARTLGREHAMGNGYANRAAEIRGACPVMAILPPGAAPARLDFAAVNAAARSELATLLARWLPDGRVNGREYMARNPRRGDRHPGSFKVNLRTCRWSDFAVGASGGDPVSLAAYLFGLSQIDAARRLASMLGVH